MEPLGKELASTPGRTAQPPAAREVPRRRECTIGMTPDAAPDSLGLGASAPAAHSCWMAGASQDGTSARSCSPRAPRTFTGRLVSLQEELEAIDWYQQRVDATEDPELKHILAHNRDEEKEHASMILEWIRRRDVAFARMLKKHTGHSGPIVTEEEEAEASGEADVERRGEKGKR